MREIDLGVGSSPLTRGTPTNLTQSQDTNRFIPAYAGNSIDAYEGDDIWTVHPRLRGELKRLLSTVFTDEGSSPLTRGTRV